LFLKPCLPVFPEEKPVKVLDKFIEMDLHELSIYHHNSSFAMKFEDLVFIQEYFKDKGRNPIETEVIVLDTYWSDHCRHTTFETVLKEVEIKKSIFSKRIEKSYENYISLRNRLNYQDRPITLMDLATIFSKYLIKSNLAEDIEVSEEVNACSVRVNFKDENYLLMFKNETHNHPTEIEPFGGASTCIGGAIRDPLSGRAFVYQATRVSGAGDVLKPIDKTRKGKLPQAIITKKATEGFSSYGNQIGLATTLVREIYHKGYEAKRLELGAVVGFVKESDIKREKPVNGDYVILIGGYTGRDGIGGATGSSKSHNQKSIEVASSEVQKGNAPTERKLQRLFLHSEVTKIIKKANDFGAGGVAVAIGELAEGMIINLDKVPIKYHGLNATELAVSESQERMAVVIDPKDYQILKDFVVYENLTMHHVATVNDSNKLIMIKNGIEVVNIDRSFLKTNGIRQKASATIIASSKISPFDFQTSSFHEAINYAISSINTASQQGMIEYFDSTIGSTTVLMPFGGKLSRTEVDASVQRIPINRKDCDLASVLTFGFNPYVTEWSPYHGAYLACVEAISKCVAINGNYRKIRFSFQEYFKRLEKDNEAWGSVLSALLGALQAQIDFNLPAIGGKDSMSGSFEDLHVPPTFVAFAVTTAFSNGVISPEFKETGNHIYLYKPKYDEDKLPIIEELLKNYDYIRDMMSSGLIVSAKSVLFGGWLEAVIKMSFGNNLGVKLEDYLEIRDFVKLNYGGMVIETTDLISRDDFVLLGKLTDDAMIEYKIDRISLADLFDRHKSLLERLYPITSSDFKEDLECYSVKDNHELAIIKSSQVKVCIVVFPGSNCELDSKRAFEEAGASVDLVIFNNQTKEGIDKSINNLSKQIDECDIFMIPGGFSSGDEPDGSGKFIVAVLLNNKVKAAIERLQARKGLILGICNGFQALIKSGLLPFGKLGEVYQDSPTLTINNINRHVSKFVKTKVVNNNNPWYHKIDNGSIHNVIISHGEGRFVASESVMEKLIEQNQIVTQYVDELGKVSKDGRYNPNGSTCSVEGIVSPDGLILGKMAHSERYIEGLYKNIPGLKHENIFLCAVEAIRRGGLNGDN
jgi:phosphoribosylformylglycinamidine synthase